MVPLRALPALAVLSLALLAGCSGSPPEPSAVEDEPAAPAPVDSTSEHAFELPASVGTPVVGVNAPVGSPRNGGSFDVPADASLLVIEAEWTCVSPSCGLDVVLYRGDEMQSVHEVSSPARIEVQAPGEGGWSVGAFPSRGGSAIVDARGVFHVTVTHPPLPAEE